MNGLEGKTLNIACMTDGLKEQYPWAGQKVPITFEKEYPTWYLCTVQSHRNPNGFSDSVPYKTTIKKHDLKIGRLAIVN